MSQCTTSPKELGRVKGVVVRLDLSIVAILPMSIMSGESDVVREKVLAVKSLMVLARVTVLRKPKPLRRSESVSLTVDGVLCRTVSTGRSLGVVDCGLSSVRR